MASANAYDVIVIGSGAGGGTLVHRLAPSRKRILLLERGDYVRREKDNRDSRAVNFEGKYQSKEVWKDSAGNDLHPHTNRCCLESVLSDRQVVELFHLQFVRLLCAGPDKGPLRHQRRLQPAFLF